MGRLLTLLLLFAGLMLVLTQGGRLIDLVSVNLLSLKTLAAGRAAQDDETMALTDIGACRLAHATGRLHLVRQQYEQALPYLEQSVACKKGQVADQWAWFDLARAQLAVGDLTGAAVSFAESDGYDYLARLARQAAEDEDRLHQTELWRLAIAVDPNRQLAYIQLAKLMTASDPEQAEALFQQAIEQDPLGREGYLELADFYARRTQLEAAGQVLTQAAARLPQDVAVLRAMAANAGASGRISEAVDYYLQVAALSETETQRAEAYFDLGELTAADRNWASALTFYRLAVAHGPESSDYLLALGHAYHEQGCLDQAGQLYQQLLGQVPDSKMVATVEARMAELAGQAKSPGVDCPPLP